MAERIRCTIADTPVKYERHSIGVTVSIGFACFGQEETNSDLLLRKADRALYCAKEAGRNRVKAWMPEYEVDHAGQTMD